MTPELKTKWVEALRSGEYKQSSGTLKTLAGTYCCLGVLREITNPDDRRGSHFADGRSDGGDGNYLTEAQLAEFGMSPEQQQVYARMNDCGYTFKGIADAIAKDAAL